MSKLSEDKINQIPILFEKLGTKKAVAEELKISPTTVSKYLMLSQLPSEAKIEKKPRVKITEEVVQQINELYSQYGNQSFVAKKLGITANTVKKYLNEDNLKLTEKFFDDRDALWYYIIHLFGIYDEENDVPVSGHNIMLMSKFTSQGISYRSQLLTLKYHYEILGNRVKEQYKTIGIIPYILDNARTYYERQIKKQEEILEDISRQLEKDRIEIKYKPSTYLNKRKGRKKKIDLKKLGVENN